MELLIDADYETIRREFDQPNADGSSRVQLRSSVFLLLRSSSIAIKDDFATKCTEEFPGKFKVLNDANDPLQQLVVLREDVSKFLRFHDSSRESGGFINKLPDEIHSQWKSSESVLPKLLAAGTIVENLKKKKPDERTGRSPWIWLRHQAKALEGTAADEKNCMTLFEEWVAGIPNAERDEWAVTAERNSGQGDKAADVVRHLKTHKNVILEGVAGSGKTHLLGALKEKYEGRTTVLVFHPSTSYEDFVVGLRPQGNSFVVVPGPFLLMCERASRDPKHDYLLFIDEVNRANTARVLGDLLMVIESSKRSLLRGEFQENLDETENFWDWKSENFRTVLTDAELCSRNDLVSVQLQTPLDGRRKHLIVPPNLHILGTMNTTDRSVGTIDLALRRRFRWITAEVLASEKLKHVLGKDRADELAQVIEWHDWANEMLRRNVGPDSQLGHSYFFTSNASALEVAEALVNQLAEIAHTFNISDTLVDSIFTGEAPELPGNLRLHQHGRGLGKRFLTIMPRA